MKYAIFSDVHANADALERMWADAVQCGVESFVCLGDVVGYGPLPAEALARVRSGASLVLAGNHDDAVSGRISAENFIDLAGDAVSRHREALSKDDLDWLRSLPHTAEIEGAALTHGDLTSPEDFLYIDSEESAAANFAATEAQLVFAGHTHVPCIFLTGESGRVYTLPMQDFSLEDNKRYIVNVGSVGYPREENGECHSTYVLYDTRERTVRYRVLPFAVSSVLQRGQSPRRSRRRLILLATALGLLALSAAALAAVTLLRTPEPAVIVKSAEDKPLLRQSLVFAGTERKFRVNINLEKGSPEALVKVECKDAAGKLVKPYSQVVTKSYQALLRPPQQTCQAVISVYATQSNNPPKIERFAPEIEKASR